MNKLAFGLVLALAYVPLSACNQQPVKKATSIFKQERRGDHERRRGGGHGLKRACAADLEKYCAGQDRGRARRECLQSHLDQLSADCKTAVESRGKGRRRRDGDDL